MLVYSQDWKLLIPYENKILNIIEIVKITTLIWWLHLVNNYYEKNKEIQCRLTITYNVTYQNIQIIHSYLASAVHTKPLGKGYR